MSNFQNIDSNCADGLCERPFHEALLENTSPQVRLNFLLKLKENGFCSKTKIEESSGAVSGLLRQALQEG
jgi:hypothetical protein